MCILETLFSYHRSLVASEKSCCFVLSIVTAFLSDGWSLRFLLKQHTARKWYSHKRPRMLCPGPGAGALLISVGLAVFACSGTQRASEAQYVRTLSQGLGGRGSFWGEAGSTYSHWHSCFLQKLSFLPVVPMKVPWSVCPPLVFEIGSLYIALAVLDSPCRPG